MVAVDGDPVVAGAGAARLSLLVGVFFTDQRPRISRPGNILRFRLDFENLLVAQREQIVQRGCAIRPRTCLRVLLVHCDPKMKKTPIPRGLRWFNSGQSPVSQKKPK